MIGQADNLEVKENIAHWKYNRLDLSPILYKEPASLYTGLHKIEMQDHELDEVLDWQLLEKAKAAIEKKEKLYAELAINNTNRTVGTILSNEITKKYRGEGLPADTIHFKFNGTAGQSFAAFAVHGLTLELEGDANDYFGKGLSGARLIIYPDKRSAYKPEENIIIGNVAFYGATSGEAFIHGKAGERFCVRNSGVNAVVESVGDHGCEYMTGGRVVVLGDTGRNFAAGMSGGIAYIYDVKGKFADNCNTEMVDLDPVDDEDVETLQHMIAKHYDYTGSALAKFILDDLDNQLKNFVKVFPKDYKKILKQPVFRQSTEEVRRDKI
jgi:glutamate synthase (NADPH/NADH) large chain